MHKWGDNHTKKYCRNYTKLGIVFHFQAKKGKDDTKTDAILHSTRA